MFALRKAWEISEALVHAHAAAPEDGRTPMTSGIFAAGEDFGRERERCPHESHVARHSIVLRLVLRTQSRSKKICGPGKQSWSAARPGQPEGSLQAKDLREKDGFP